MSYLDNLRVFVRVIELGSITAGGRDLRLSPGGASNRIKDLESRFGVRLLNRTTRTLTPTEIGQVLYQNARKVIDALEEAEAAMGTFSGMPQGALRVVAPLGLGRRLIAPLVPEFCRENPEISIRLRLSDRSVNIIEDAIDIAFFLGQPEDSTLTWRQIADCRRVLVAAPAYLSERGTPATPDDLHQHNCLLLRFPRSPEFYWTLQTADGPQKLMVAGTFDADDGDVLTGWALAGAGIANRPFYEVGKHIETGELVEILPETPPMPARFGCLTPHRQFQDPKVRLFMDYAIKALKGVI